MKNKQLLKQWILYAQSDLDAAKKLYSAKKPTQWTYLLVLWHCQQTIEKMLKMIIIKKDKELLKIHDLMRLSKLSEIKLTEENKTFLENLNEFYLRSRYPDLIYPALPKPTKELTFKYLNKTEKFFLWLKKQ
ncbi:MAG: HEPN domain-containing protein [bacterium]